MTTEKKLTAKQIENLVLDEREKPQYLKLRERWELDYAYYSLEDYDAGEGYQSYTSNKPRTTADKIISYLTEAAMTVRTRYNRNDPETAESGTNLEKFIRGCIRMGDDRLTAMLSPMLQDQLAWYIAVRGWYAGRAMFNKQDNGAIKCEIEPFDPLNTTWKIGHDGLNWIARTMSRTPEFIKNTYNVNMEFSSNDYETGIEVHEYIDRFTRSVVANGRYLVRPQRHENKNLNGEPIVPAFIGYVGPQPFVQGKYSGDDVFGDVGESVFSHIRGLIDNQNKSLSDWQTLVRRAVKHPMILRSRDGNLRLMDDPYREGANISLKDGENIELAPEMKLVADAGAYIGTVNSEMQQGTVPDIVFGDIQFQLSGHAANILRAGAQHQVAHRMKAMGSAMTQIANILRNQYQSGRFGKLKFDGVMGETQTYFDEEIEPDDLKKAGNLEIMFKNSLGMEDPARFSTAQMLREGPVPLAPDTFIFNEILDVEDPDKWKKEIMAQQGVRNEPKAMAYNMWEGLLENQRPVEAQFYLDQIQRQYMNEQREEYIRKLQFQQAIMTLQSQLGMMQQGGMQQPPGQPQPNPNGERPSMNNNNGVVSGAESGYDLFRRTTPPNNTRAPGEPRPGARGN
jgi:hypothetical protein